MNAQQLPPMRGVEMRGLRAKVLDRLKAGPQSEQELSARLDVGRDDVAEACGRLLVDGKVALRPDFTYALKVARR